MLKSILKRFIKGVVGGGVASALTVLFSSGAVTSVTELKTLTFSLIVGFITGALLAIQKWVSWTDAPQG